MRTYIGQATFDSVPLSVDDRSHKFDVTDHISFKIIHKDNSGLDRPFNLEQDPHESYLF